MQTQVRESSQQPEAGSGVNPPLEPPEAGGGVNPPLKPPEGVWP